MARFAILYDELVRSHPLLRYALWCHVSVGCDLWCNAGEAAAIIRREIDQHPAIFDGAFESGPIELFPSVGLEHLIVIRSHPEMFGREIRAARTTGASVDVITVEEIRDQHEQRARDSLNSLARVRATL